MSFDLELTGRRALVTAGTKGIGAAVVEVLHNPGGDVLAITREGGRELLVPFVSAMVPTVDPVAGFVVVDPPPGLLEL